MVLAIDSATSWAPSHVRADSTGDHRSGVTPMGSVWVPVGSNTHTRPTRARARHVAPKTSSLTEVDTHAAGATSTERMTTDAVLPSRRGPITSTAFCGSAA